MIMMKQIAKNISRILYASGTVFLFLSASINTTGNAFNLMQRILFGLFYLSFVLAIYYSEKRVLTAIVAHAGFCSFIIVMLFIAMIGMKNSNEILRIQSISTIFIAQILFSALFIITIFDKKYTYVIELRDNLLFYPLVFWSIMVVPIVFPSFTIILQKMTETILAILTFEQAKAYWDYMTSRNRI